MSKSKPSAGAMRAAKAISHDAYLSLEDIARHIDRDSGLTDAIEALQDALVCLDGARYEPGGKIYDEEPYAMQKKALNRLTQ